MISDQDVIQKFRNLSKVSVDAKITTAQLFRGIPPELWKDAHPYGCARQRAIFNSFNVIPKYCFDCYKVCIAPRNIIELFKLLMVFEKVALPLDNTRKCMVEERSDCSGTYKGLIFCRSIEEGNEVRKIMRKAVSEDIAPQVSVTLKRGCSEFERAHPEYGRIDRPKLIMQYKKDWQIHEDFIDNNFVYQPYAADATADISDITADGLTTYTRGDVLRMQFWLRYAATIGDTSYLAITGMDMPPLPNIKRPPFRNTIPVKKSK